MNEFEQNLSTLFDDYKKLEKEIQNELKTLKYE